MKAAARGPRAGACGTGAGAGTAGVGAVDARAPLFLGLTAGLGERWAAAEVVGSGLATASPSSLVL